MPASIPAGASCATSTPAIPSRSSAVGSARPVLLDSTGPILSSALFDIPCEQATRGLGPGDSLLLYTDGVTEARGPGGMFGQDRLVSAILRGHRGSGLLDGLLSEVVAFSNSPNHQDDITLLTLDLAGTATDEAAGLLRLGIRHPVNRCPALITDAAWDTAPAPGSRARRVQVDTAIG